MLVCDKLDEEFDCTGVWLLVEELPGDVEVAAAVVGSTAAVDAAVVASAVFAAVASAAFAAVASAAFAAATCAANLRA